MATQSQAVSDRAKNKGDSKTPETTEGTTKLRDAGTLNAPDPKWSIRANALLEKHQEKQEKSPLSPSEQVKKILSIVCSKQEHSECWIRADGKEWGIPYIAVCSCDCHR